MRFAPDKFELDRFAPDKFAPTKLTPDKFAPNNSTFVKFACDKSDPSKSTCAILLLDISAFEKSILWNFDSEISILLILEFEKSSSNRFEYFCNISISDFS